MAAPDTLKTRREFLQVAATRRRCAMPGLVVQMSIRGDRAPARVGYTVTRKVGNAVERNRVKRRLRAVVRERIGERRGNDYVIIGRRAALARPFEALVGDFDTAMRRLEGMGH